MHGLLARATGQGGGPRVRPAPAQVGVAPAAWRELDETVDATARRAEPPAQPPTQPTTEPALPSGALRPDDLRARLQPVASSTESPLPRATQPAALPAPAPLPVSASDPSTPIATPRGSAAQHAPRTEARRPASLQAPRVASLVAPDHEPAALAAAPLPRAARRQSVPAATPDAHATESVVHVSIGRVELTALVPPASARSRAPARQPTISLADYLRAGAGGRK